LLIVRGLLGALLVLSAPFPSWPPIFIAARVAEGPSLPPVALPAEQGSEGRSTPSPTSTFRASGAPLTERYWLAIRSAWLFIATVVAIAVHESGHLLCGLAAGIPMRQMTVGTGPLLFRRRFGELWFELRLLPLLGLVNPYPSATIRRVRLAVMLLGGVLANVAAIALIAVVTKGVAVTAAAGESIGAIVLVQAWMIMANLLPFTVKSKDGRVGTDGLQLLRLLRVKSSAPTAIGTAYAQMIATYAHGGVPPPFTPASSRLMYQLFRIDRWTSPAAAREFVEALLRELGRDILPAAEEALAVDSLLTHAFVWGDASLRPQLDALAQRAVRLVPHADTLSGSRGAALVEIGRYAEGKALLEALIARSGLAPFDIFMTEVHLARAEHGLGNREAASRWAVAARRSAETCNTLATSLMLTRMDAELAGGGSD
jgi:Peptidase family M50